MRALVLDEDANVLLVNFNWPDPGLADGFLACPGGGVALGGFRMSGWEGQWDTWYLVRVGHFTPAPRVDLAAEAVHGVRCFSPAV